MTKPIRSGGQWISTVGVGLLILGVMWLISLYVNAGPQGYSIQPPKGAGLLYLYLAVPMIVLGIIILLAGQVAGKRQK